MTSSNRILFLGLSQVGKTSIVNVVFEGISPELTKKNLATMNYKRSLIDFSGKVISIIEVGGQIPFLEESFSKHRIHIYSNLDSLIFVVDTSVPEYFEKAHSYYEKACDVALELNRRVKLAVLAHKIDLVPEMEKSKIVNLLEDTFIKNSKFRAKLYATSIFDKTIFKAIYHIIK